jgi:hypothetical protein
VFIIFCDLSFKPLKSKLKGEKFFFSKMADDKYITPMYFEIAYLPLNFSSLVKLLSYFESPFWRFPDVDLKSELSLFVYISSAAFNMARRGKELSSDTKNAIVKLSEGGHSGRKLSAMLEINPATVHAEVFKTISNQEFC